MSISASVSRRDDLSFSSELDSGRNGLLCAVSVGVILLFIHGGSNEPFMDDFSYAKTALEFARTGHFVYNGWATAMLGWQVPWGALVIKLFGFSFRALQLSMVPLSMASVYLFHQVLRRFGITPANAILGTLTLALSPLFLPLAVSFMTDIPGLLVILLCMHMCQSAAAARTARTAILWLTAATAVNIFGGTVRQIAWLGALIMVPSTAWMLRRWRGMKLAGALLFLLSFLSVLGFMHWFAAQPYNVPQHVFNGPISMRMAIHGIVQAAKTILCLLLIVLPVMVAWIGPLRRLPASRRWSIVVASALITAALAVLSAHRGADGLLAPWLRPLIAAQSFSISIYPGVSVEKCLFLLAIGLTFIVLLGSASFLALMSDSYRQVGWQRPLRFPSEALLIVGPFSLAYTAFLLPSGVYIFIQDRYVLGLVPTAVIFFSCFIKRGSVCAFQGRP